MVGHPGRSPLERLTRALGAVAPPMDACHHARADHPVRAFSSRLIQGTPPPGGACAVPTYDYQCRSCGVITEVVHSMLEDGPSECERCGGQLRRVVHPTGIIFKGSGFYKTDSRSSSSGSVSGGTRGPKPSGEAGTTPAPSDGGTAGKGSGSSAGVTDAPKGTGSGSAATD